MVKKRMDVRNSDSHGTVIQQASGPHPGSLQTWNKHLTVKFLGSITSACPCFGDACLLKCNCGSAGESEGERGSVCISANVIVAFNLQHLTRTSARKSFHVPPICISFTIRLYICACEGHSLLMPQQFQRELMHVTFRFKRSFSGLDHSCRRMTWN